MSMSKAVKDFWLENARLRAGLPPWSNAKGGGGMLAKVLLAAALLGSGGSGLLAGRYYYQRDTVVEKQHGSLLQHLEDGGFHLPPQ